MPLSSPLLTTARGEKDRLAWAYYQPEFNTGSDSALLLARSWLENCHRSHADCICKKDAETRNWKPTRLIKIDTEHCRLCVGDEIPQDVRYATLSHCWGLVANKVVLTTRNINAFKERLPDLAQLKTFDDAIAITRKLGIEYLWIDSFCIIQDSREDWLKEAAVMNLIFKYSLCTISATSAWDDTKGCLFDRNIDRELPVRVAAAMFQDSGEMSAGRTGQWDIQNTVSVWDCDLTSAVNDRGWILQEVVTTKILTVRPIVC